MTKEITSKKILSLNKKPSSWFGVKYLFNIYRGCEHKCIYCDSRSLCYGIENFDELNVKINAIELLEKELKNKRKKGTLGTGAMSDPYTISEKKYMLTRKSLEIVEKYKYPIHITTKSNLILRDVDILQEVNKIYASVAITITASDDDLAEKIEPFASSSSDRFKALGILSTLGICTSITMMPILPFIEDNEKNIRQIVEKAGFYGVKYIVPWLGMSLRDRQRIYYYEKLDEYFPGVKDKYIKRFNDRYRCTVRNINKLSEILKEECYRQGIALKMPMYEEKVAKIQLSFLD